MNYPYAVSFIAGTDNGWC